MFRSLLTLYRYVLAVLVFSLVSRLLPRSNRMDAAIIAMVQAIMADTNEAGRRYRAAVRCFEARHGVTR
jgi:hypothetical protein